MFTNQISEIERIMHNYRDVPVVVEGKKDRYVLQKLGFSRIIEISGKTIDKIVEDIFSENTQSVIILTDFDKEGVKKATELTNFLQHHHVNINSFARNRIRTLFKVHKIEELIHFTKFIDFMEDGYHGKTSSVYNKIFNRSRVHGRWYSREARRYRSDIRSD